MNITVSTLQDEIKKNQNTKTKEKFRIILMLLSSNLFVFILCFLSMKNSVKTSENTKPLLTLQPGHQWLVVPIQTLLVDKDQKIVSLYNAEKKL